MREGFRFLSDEGGATAIEYGLIASCVVIAIIAGVMALGGNVADAYAAVVVAVQNAAGGQ